jgi:hypothetical protein
LRLVQFRLDDRGRRSGGKRLSAIFGQRFAGKKNGFFRSIDGTRRTGITRSIRRTMVKTALCWTAWFETARLATTIFGTALVAAAIVVVAGFVTTGLAALWRSVFGGWQVAAAYSGTLRASAAMAATAPAEAASTTISTTITTPVSSTISAAAVVLAAAGARRVVLRGIVVGRKILRGGSVGFGLALFGVVVSVIVDFGGVRVCDFAFRSVLFDDVGLLAVREGLVMRWFLMRRFALK